MEYTKPKYSLLNLTHKFKSTMETFKGLYSITKDDKRFISISKLIDPEEERQTISTNKTKSSNNFSHDSMVKSLLQLSKISTNYIKSLKDSLKKFMDKNKKKVKFSQIFGNSYPKKIIKEAFFLNPKNKQKFKLQIKSWRSILLYGPPGVGKTMITHAIASELKRTIFWVSLSSLISKFMGESEKMVEVLFELAKEYQPSLIIMEEVDSIGRKRSKEESNAERRLKIEFLRHLDMISDCEEEVGFIGTTNLPWDLDIAFLRRFDKKILVSVLNKRDRVFMMRNSFEGIFCLDDEGYSVLGDLSLGLNGKEINDFIRDVVIQECMEEDCKAIDLAFLRKVLRNHKPCISKRNFENYVKFLRKFGEEQQLEDIEDNLYKPENLDYII